MNDAELVQFNEAVNNCKWKSGNRYTVDGKTVATYTDVCTACGGSCQGVISSGRCPTIINFYRDKEMADADRVRKYLRYTP